MVNATNKSDPSQQSATPTPENNEAGSPPPPKKDPPKKPPEEDKSDDQDEDGGRDTSWDKLSEKDKQELLDTFGMAIVGPQIMDQLLPDEEELEEKMEWEMETFGPDFVT